MELPELPKVKSAGVKRVSRKALPSIGSDFGMASGKKEEAAEYAAAMGQAFAISKAQNKHQKAKARARERSAQAAAEKRKRR
tara:strand:- start:1269 stop:1514 length:246 start_codon:yes stop_codon:yes gene_type:complete